MRKISVLTATKISTERWMAGLLLLSSIFFLTLSQPVHAVDNSTISNEYALKAVCLYNFIKFTQWPQEKNLEESASLDIHVVGNSGFSEALEELKDQFKKKNVSIIHHGHYHKGMDLRGDHLLFISSTEKHKMKEILASIKGSAVLTVSDADGFLEAGGMISLVLDNNKVRWKINQTAVNYAGMKISSKLLQLALQVESFPGQFDKYPYDLERKNPLALLENTFAFHFMTANDLTDKLI